MTRRVGTLVMSTSVIVVALFLFAVSATGLAQPREKTARIGVLFIGSRDQPHLEAFKQGLLERGYVEDKNISLEYRYAEGQQDRLGELAAQLVRERVDIIVTTASISAQAARKATTIIPIVMSTNKPEWPQISIKKA